MDKVLIIILQSEFNQLSNTLDNMTIKGTGTINFPPHSILSKDGMDTKVTKQQTPHNETKKSKIAF